MFVIQDQVTKNFLSDFSFQLVNENNNEWLYITSTGLLGTRFYTKKDNAKKILNMLQKYNKESGANRNLQIVNINKDLPVGERIIEIFRKKV